MIGFVSVFVDLSVQDGREMFLKKAFLSPKGRSLCPTGALGETLSPIFRFVHMRDYHAARGDI